MNRFVVWIALFCLPGMSCNNSVEINGPYREVTVVYGLLDYGKSANYLRIEKSFLDDESGYLLAEDPDNLFYTDGAIEVYLEPCNNTEADHRIPLQKVDGDTLGLAKPQGIFASMPNILYRTTQALDKNACYRICIVKNGTSDTIRAETQLVQSFVVFYPTRPGAYIDFTGSDDITYTCQYAVNGKVYELWMLFHYAEVNTLTGDSTFHTINWQIFKNVYSDNLYGIGNISYPMSAHSFFNFLSDNIDDDPDVRRYALGVDFEWIAGGEEIYDIVRNEIANLGINEAYISPDYTNVSGGIGLFSSVYDTLITNVHLSNETIDSIACGLTTSHLGFVSTPFDPWYPGCHF